MKKITAILSIFLLLAGCETIKTVVTNPDVLEGIRAIVKGVGDEIVEKNPIYRATFDEINQSLADYNGEEISTEDLLRLLTEGIGDNELLKDEIKEKLQEAVQGVTASGSYEDAESIVWKAADLL